MPKVFLFQTKIKEEDLDDSLVRLERRLCFLERLVMGSRYRTLSQPNLVDPLLEAISKMRSLTEDRERFAILSEMLQEYGPFLQNMDQFDGNCDPDLVKWELIMCQEDELRRKAAMAESIVEHQKVIDSQVLRDLDPFKENLAKLHTVAIKQEQEANRLSRETQNLIENYNQLLTKIKGRLVAWDKKLLAFEARKNERKPGDIIPDFD